MANRRPVKTYYNGGERVASATTLEAAVVAATKRLIRKDYRFCIIVRNGKKRAHLIREYNTITVTTHGQTDW